MWGSCGAFGSWGGDIEGCTHLQIGALLLLPSDHVKKRPQHVLTITACCHPSHHDGGVTSSEAVSPNKLLLLWSVLPGILSWQHGK